MQIIVSDVTYMRNEICVAGWCPDERRMIRPLADVGKHWPTALAGPELFGMGNVLEMTPVGISNSRGLPHSREDLIVKGRPQVVNTVAEDEIAAALSDSESPSVHDLFEGNLREDRFVMGGADCPSLGAVHVACRTIRFYEDEWEGRKKLRCSFRDADAAGFRLPVTSVPLHDIWREGGTDALNELASDQDSAHVRIGLAHPMGDGRAFAMVNNMSFY